MKLSDRLTVAAFTKAFSLSEKKKAFVAACVYQRAAFWCFDFDTKDSAIRNKEYGYKELHRHNSLSDYPRILKNIFYLMRLPWTLPNLLGLLQSAIRNAGNGGLFSVTLQSYMTIIIESQIQKVLFYKIQIFFLYLYNNTVIFYNSNL